jgi:prevent-host-death family protein
LLVGQVSVHEARNNLSRLIKEAQAGEDVVIASHGKPVARLVPVRRQTGADILKWLEANPMSESRRRTRAEIDAAIAAERESWD